MRTGGLVILFATALLARGAALSPDQEKDSFRLADESLVVELAAAEPDVVSPVAITWDADGKLYVAEMRDYPLDSGGGLIRRLEDRDGDGFYESATVFADKLSFPNGVLPWNGGILVTAAPHILFLKDTNGDGRADERRIVLTGFAEGNQQLRVNGLLWGLDGWVYGANGRSDGEMQSPAGGTKISLRGHDFRFRPDTGEFEALAGRSQFGLARDDWGNRFLSWNTIPIRHDAIPERYLKRNSSLNTADGLQNLLPAGDIGEVFPLTPAPQTFNQESTSHFNALAGLTIYRGNALPRSYYGNAFMGETLRNLVHRRSLAPNGATFIAERTETGREFLASTDPWFHPVNFAMGPDGALYVVDFYRQWVEHPGYVPERFRDQFAWRTGSEHGRIWRIRSRGQLPRANPPSLNDASAWQRDTAQRLVIERSDRSNVAQIKQVASGSSNPVARVQALHTLRRLGVLDDRLLRAALAGSQPRVRETAIQLAEGRLAQSREFLRSVARLTSDADARVRLQAALSLGEAPASERAPVLAQMAVRSDLDPLLSLAIRSSMGDHAWLLLEQISKKPERAGEPPPFARLELTRALAAEVAAKGDSEDRDSLLRMLAKAGQTRAKVSQLAILSGFLRGASMTNPAWRGQIHAWLASYENGFVPKMINLADHLTERNETPAAVRDLAVDVLGRVHPSTASNTFLKLLRPPHSSSTQAAAAETLTQMGDPVLLRQALDGWSQYQVATRRKILAGSARSAATLSALAASLEQGLVAPAEIDAPLRQSLLRFPQLKPPVRNLLERNAAPDRKRLIDQFKASLPGNGDRARGAAIFARLCLQCHAIQGRGQQVGPELSGAGTRGREALLIDLLDPSREVAPDFINYQVSTIAGEILNGLLVTEDAASVVLRRPNLPDERIPRASLKEVRATGQSLMPDGLEVNLSPEEIAGLLEFLGHPDRALLP